MLATASTAEKAALARGAGADDVVLYTEDDFVAEVTRLTKARAWTSCTTASADHLRRRAGSAAPARDDGALSARPAARSRRWTRRCSTGKGSLFLTRPTLTHYVAAREELLARASAVLGQVASGALDVRIGGRYPLEEAGRAHDDLEGRRTTGKVLIIP